MAAPEIEDRIREELHRAPAAVVCAYLFGSVEARTQSDLERALERALGRPVQLVVLNRAPADLVHRVFRDGRVVLDRDRAARIRFEVARRNEYFDLEPIRRLYRGPRPPSA